MLFVFLSKSKKENKEENSCTSTFLSVKCYVNIRSIRLHIMCIIAKTFSHKLGRLEKNTERCMKQWEQLKTTSKKWENKKSASCRHGDIEMNGASTDIEIYTESIQRANVYSHTNTHTLTQTHKHTNIHTNKHTQTHIENACTIVCQHFRRMDIFSVPVFWFYWNIVKNWKVKQTFRQSPP